MSLETIKVKLEDGTIHTLDGSPLPERAYALLVILPEPTDAKPSSDQDPFEAYLAALRAHPAPDRIDDLSDAELNGLVHAARRAP
jgi:hypothetical protein